MPLSFLLSPQSTYRDRRLFGPAILCEFMLATSCAKPHLLGLGQETKTCSRVGQSNQAQSLQRGPCKGACLSNGCFNGWSNPCGWHTSSEETKWIGQTKSERVQHQHGPKKTRPTTGQAVCVCVQIREPPNMVGFFLGPLESRFREGYPQKKTHPDGAAPWPPSTPSAPHLRSSAALASLGARAPAQGRCA